MFAIRYAILLLPAFQELESGPATTIRLQHYEVRGQCVLTGRIIQLSERFASEDRYEAYDQRVIFRHVYLACSVAASRMDTVKIPICDGLASQQEWINRSFKVLKNNNALPKHCRIVILIIADDP